MDADGHGKARALVLGLGIACVGIAGFLAGYSGLVSCVVAVVSVVCSQFAMSIGSFAAYLGTAGAWVSAELGGFACCVVIGFVSSAFMPISVCRWCPSLRSVLGRVTGSLRALLASWVHALQSVVSLASSWASSFVASKASTIGILGIPFASIAVVMPLLFLVVTSLLLCLGLSSRCRCGWGFGLSLGLAVL